MSHIPTSRRYDPDSNESLAQFRAAQIVDAYRIQVRKQHGGNKSQSRVTHMSAATPHLFVCDDQRILTVAALQDANPAETVISCRLKRS